MKVRAKWNVAYDNVMRKGGEVFDMLDSHYEQFKSDVVVVETAPSKLSEERTKPVKEAKTKTVKKVVKK